MQGLSTSLRLLWAMLYKCKLEMVTSTRVFFGLFLLSLR